MQSEERVNQELISLLREQTDRLEKGDANGSF